MAGARPPRRRGVLSVMSRRRQQLASAAAAAVAVTAAVLLGGAPAVAVPAPPAVAVTHLSAALMVRQQQARMGPTWSFAPDGRRKFRFGNLCAETGLCTAEYRYPCSSRPEGICARTVASRCLWRCGSNDTLGGAEASDDNVPDATTDSDGEAVVLADTVVEDGLAVDGDEVNVPVLSTQQVDGGQNGSDSGLSTPVAPVVVPVSNESSVEQPDVSIGGVPIDVAAPEVTADSGEDALVPTDAGVEDALDAEGDVEGTTVLPTPTLPTGEGGDGSNGEASTTNGVPGGITAPEVTADPSEDVVVPTDASVEDASEVGGDDESAILFPTLDVDVPDLTTDPAVDAPELTTDPTGDTPELTTDPAVDAADPTEVPEESADEAAATDAPSSVPYTFGDGVRTCTADTMRTRRDIRTYSADELSALTTAWAALYASSTLTDFTAIHVAAHHVAHGGAAFLPWHTLFLLELEAALRSISPELTLPYWPWAADAKDLAAAPVWAASTFGRAATGDCIVDGTFFGVTGSRGRCVLRGFTSVSGGIHPVAVVQQGTIDQAVRAEGGGYATFAAAAEAFHNELHVSLAGDMGVGYSPDDPAFWAHHAYVDSWWAARREWSPDDYVGTHRGVPVSTTDVLWPYNVTVADAMALPCVRYAPMMDAATVSRQADTPVVTRAEAEVLVARREAIVGPPSIEFAVRMGDDRETAEAARVVAVAVQVEAAVSGTIDVSVYERVEEAPVGGYFNGSEDVARGPDGVPDEPVPVLYAGGDAEYPPRPPKNAVGAPAFSPDTAPAYPPGAAPAYPSGTAPAYPPGAAPAYPSGTAPAYPSGTAPAYPSGTAPAYASGTVPTYASGAVPTYSLEEPPTYSPQQASAYPATGVGAPTPSSTPECSTSPGESHSPAYASGSYPTDSPAIAPSYSPAATPTYLEAAPAYSGEATPAYSEEEAPAYSEEATPIYSEVDATPTYSDEKGSGDYSVGTPAYPGTATPTSSPEATPASYDGADPYTYPGSTPDHTACADDSDGGEAGLFPSEEPTESPSDEVEGEETAAPGGYEDTWTGNDPYGASATTEPTGPADGDSGATATPTPYSELVGGDGDTSPAPYSGPYDEVDDEAAATSSPSAGSYGLADEAALATPDAPSEYAAESPVGTATAVPYAPGTVYGSDGGDAPVAAATDEPYAPGTVYGSDGGDAPVAAATAAPYAPGTEYGSDGGDQGGTTATPSPSAGPYGLAAEAATLATDAPTTDGEGEAPTGAPAVPYAPVVSATPVPYRDVNGLPAGTTYGSVHE